MKVLHFITSLDQSAGGVAAYLQLLTKGLGELCELHIVTSNSQNPLPIEKAMVHYLPLGLRQYKSFKKNYIKLIESIQPDLVHINAIWQPQTWWAQKWVQQKGIPVILSPHGMLEPYILARHPLKKKIALALFQHKAIKRANYIHATADSEMVNLRKFGVKQEIAVVPNAIETEGINCKEQWNQVQNLLFLSRIHPKKGIEFLVKALYHLKQEGIILQLKIAGEGDELYVNKLKQLVNYFGLESQVSFLGGVYGNKKWQLFKDADLFVLPTYSENFGIVVGEALFCGTPVITTQGTPWKELEENKCGWYIPLKIEALVQALKDATDKTSYELAEMGNNGHRLILNHFTTNIVADNMLALYNHVLLNYH